MDAQRADYLAAQKELSTVVRKVVGTAVRLADCSTARKDLHSVCWLVAL